MTKQYTPDREGREPIPTMTAMEALQHASEGEYVDGFIAWKTDRSAVYVLARTEREMIEKLTDLGLRPDQVSIDCLGGIQGTELGYGIMESVPQP